MGKSSRHERQTMKASINDLGPGISTSTFREKVAAYYRNLKVLPASADFLAHHYMSALTRQPDFDAGPVLVGCEEFGAEPSPKTIIEDYAKRTFPDITASDLSMVFELAHADMLEEISISNKSIAVALR